MKKAMFRWDVKKEHLSLSFSYSARHLELLLSFFHVPQGFLYFHSVVSLVVIIIIPFLKRFTEIN